MFFFKEIFARKQGIFYRLALIQICAFLAYLPLSFSLWARNALITQNYLLLRGLLYINSAALALCGSIYIIFRILPLGSGRLASVRSSVAVWLRRFLEAEIFLAPANIIIILILWQPDGLRLFSSLTLSALILKAIRLPLSKRCALAPIVLYLAALIGWLAIQADLAPGISFIAMMVLAAVALKSYRKIKTLVPEQLRVVTDAEKYFVFLSIHALIVFAAGQFITPENIQGTPFKVIYGPGISPYDPDANHEFYELLAPLDKDRIFFTDKVQIGAIRIDQDAVQISGEYQFGLDTFGYLKRLNSFVVDDANNEKLYLVDADTLQITKSCAGLGDYNSIVGGSATSLIYAIRGHAGRIKDRMVGSGQLFIVDMENCRSSVLEIPTVTPHVIVCSTSRNDCYVSGRWGADKITELKLDDAGMVAGVRSADIGPFALDMALDEQNLRLFITRPLAAMVDIVDLKEFQKIRQIPVSPFSRAIAYSPELDLLFTAEYIFGTLYIVRVADGRILSRVRLGDHIRDAIWDASRGVLLVAGSSRIYMARKEDLQLLMSGSGK